jgi:serine/threonine protein kinase
MGDLRIGKYQVLQRLANGGMGEVFLALQTGPAGFLRKVVIKRMRAPITENPDFVRMFLNEARLAAMLSHPNVVHILELDKAEDGSWFIVMEHIHGRSLREVLGATSRRGTPGLPPELAARVCADMLRGLHHAHEMRDPEGKRLEIIHRDVSPENVLVSFSGTVKLVDFGIAKAMAESPSTQVSSLKGKVPYLAPEQLGLQRVDARTDVYATGCVLYEMLSGQSAFPVHSNADLMEDVLHSMPVPLATRCPHVPEPLGAIVWRAMAKSPAERFSSAQEMATALEDFLLQGKLRVPPEAVGRFLAELFGAAAPAAAPPLRSPQRTEALAPSPRPVTQWQLTPTEHEFPRTEHDLSRQESAPDRQPGPPAPVPAPPAPVPAPRALISAPLAPVPAPRTLSSESLSPVLAPLAPVPAPRALSSESLALAPAPLDPGPEPVTLVPAPQQAPIPAPRALISAPVAPVAAPLAPDLAPLSPDLAPLVPQRTPTPLESHPVVQAAPPSEGRDGAPSPTLAPASVALPGRAGSARPPARAGRSRLVAAVVLGVVLLAGLAALLQSSARPPASVPVEEPGPAATAPGPDTPPSPPPVAAPLMEEPAASAPSPAPTAVPSKDKKLREPRKGRVLLHVQPSAEIYLGSQRLGSASGAPFAFELPAGRHTLTLRNDKLGIARKVTVKVPAGGRVTLREDLNLPSSRRP